jgi:hypothetical protein
MANLLLLKGDIMNRKRRRKLIYLFIIAVVLMIMTINYIPRNIDIYTKGMLYDEHGAFEKLVDMKVKGTIYYYPKEGKKFLGDIEIDGVRQHMNIQKDGKIEFMHHFDSGIIFELDNQYGQDKPIGHLIFIDDWEYVYVSLDALDNKHHAKCIVVGPANSRDEAELILSKHLRK